jgi:ketosteroid isomerase-like protein
MSAQNVELARRTLAGWSRFAETGADAFLADCYADDCVSEDFPELPDRATYIGRAGARERYRNFVEVWGGFALAPIDFIDAGDDAVIAVVGMSGRGDESGVPLDLQPAFVWEFRNGVIVRDRAFTSVDQARSAVGLRA